MTFEIMLRIFLVLLFAYLVLVGVYLYKKKQRKSRMKAVQEKPANKKAAMLCQYSDQRLCLDMMALVAVREMSVAAAKGSKVSKMEHNKP